MPHRIKPRWQHLLNIPAVATWHANLARKNIGTADVYLRRLGRACDGAHGKTPDFLLTLSQPDLEDAVTRCIDYEFSRGILGSSVIGVVKALKSFLKWHSRKVERPNAVPGANEYPNAEASQIPDPAGLQAVLKAAELRTQVMILILAHGGQRLRVIGDIKARHGLRLSNLIDLRIANGDVQFVRMPAMVDVPRVLSKNTKPFFFFLGPEACHTILAYLRQRLRAGEALTMDSPLVRAEGGAPRFMLRNSIGDCIRRAMQAAEIEAPPYIWRSYYANRCQLVESSAGFLEAWRKFFMGHAGNIQTQYANRKKLPADSVEKMRAAYAKALPMLETTVQPREDSKSKILEVMLRSAGLSQQDIDGLDLPSKTDDEVYAVMQEAMSRKGALTEDAPPATPPSPATTPGLAVPATPAAAASGAPKQKVIALGELRSALEDGWTYITMLPGDLAVVQHA